MDTQLVNHLMPALFGLIGTMVGGIISFGTQFYFQRREEIKRRRFALICLMETYSEVLDDLKTLEKGISTKIPDNYEGELWKCVQTMVGERKNSLQLPSDGLSLFYTKKNSKLAMKLKLLTSRRNATLGAMDEYNLKRRALDELCRPHMTHIGGDLTARMVVDDIRQHPELFMAMTEAESLIRQIYTWAKEDLQKGKDLLPLFNDALQDVDGKKTKLKIALT